MAIRKKEKCRPAWVTPVRVALQDGLPRPSVKKFSLQADPAQRDHDLLIAQILYREAESLLKGQKKP